MHVSRLLVRALAYLRTQITNRGLAGGSPGIGHACHCLQRCRHRPFGENLRKPADLWLFMA
jgi:hypothetical protein